MTLRAIIVDDEPLAREGVELALAEAGGIEVVASCADGTSAVTAIRDLRPDLVMLDVKMPGLDGFGVIEAVGVDEMPAVIFLTAYKEHALRAFRVNAVDYLLKPLDARELCASLERVRQRRADAQLQGEKLRRLLETLGSARTDAGASRIVVRGARRISFLDPARIDWIEASGDYVTIHAEGRQHLVRESMQRIAERLRDRGFERVHRSAIVNLARVRELVTAADGSQRIVLHDETTLRLSRGYRDAFLRALEAQ